MVVDDDELGHCVWGGHWGWDFAKTWSQADLRSGWFFWDRLVAKDADASMLARLPRPYLASVALSTNADVKYQCCFSCASTATSVVPTLVSLAWQPVSFVLLHA